MRHEKGERAESFVNGVWSSGDSALCGTCHRSTCISCREAGYVPSEGFDKAFLVKVEPKHSHYYKDVRHLERVDVYRVLTLFGVTDPCIQHAVKKLLVAGGRGAGKSMEKDLREAIDSLERALQMIAEDMAGATP